MLERVGARWAIVGVSLVVSLAAGLWWAGQLGWLFGDASADDPPRPGVVVPLEARTYGLGGAPGAVVLLEASLVIAEGEDPEVVRARQALLDDTMVALFAGRSRADVMGTQGTNQLRDELLTAARQAYPQLTIEQALITPLRVE